MICCPAVLGSEMSLPRESIVNDFVLRGDWFGASLLQPRAFESMVLYRIIHDVVPRGDWLGDVVALTARRCVHDLMYGFECFCAPRCSVRGVARRGLCLFPAPFESMVLEVVLNDLVARSDWFGDVVTLAARG